MIPARAPLDCGLFQCVNVTVVAFGTRYCVARWTVRRACYTTAVVCLFLTGVAVSGLAAHGGIVVYSYGCL